MDPEKLIQLIVRQSKLVNALASIVGDQSIIIHDLVAKCDHDNCTSPVTMIGKGMLRRCDRHAAEWIANDPSSEKEWTDTPNAKSIRNIDEYVKIMNELIVSEDEFQ